VVEYVAMEYPGDLALPENFELEASLVAHAREQLAGLAQRLGFPSAAQRVEVGATKSEIIRVAKEWEADLIVIGSHGRHGWALLLGSTANAVLHGAPCDVLAVRVKA
jgi:universal stress protein A